MLLQDFGCHISVQFTVILYLLFAFLFPNKTIYLSIFDFWRWSLSDYVGRTSIRLGAPENMGTAVGIAQNILFLTGCLTISGLRRHIWFSYAGPLQHFCIGLPGLQL